MGKWAWAIAALLASETTPPRDWSEALRVDATAMHDVIATDHPGPLNPADPFFAGRNDDQLQRALRRAQTARTFEDYFYAMQRYAASFDDGHLSYGVFGNTPDKVRRWPGFLTRYDDRGNQAVFVAEPNSGVAKGARLLSCDGLSADVFTSNRLGSRFGRWMLASQHELLGAMAFLDVGDPYVSTPRRCRFSDGGKIIDIALEWRPPQENLYQRYVFATAKKAETEWSILKDGTYWFRIPSFDGDPNSPVGQRLRELINYVHLHAANIRTSPAIIFDLRGNGGGSSDWSAQIARLLWGEAKFQHRHEAPMTVSWRASKDNLSFLQSSYAERSKGGSLSPDARAWYEDTIANLQRALAAREALWLAKPGKADTRAQARGMPSYRIRGPVYVITDPNCMSACLDAVDLWTSLGAVTAGRETGADTIYMEVRPVRLPTGIGGFSLPMKAYSGRRRGSNQPVLPKYRFGGDMADTPSLQKWIAAISKRGTH
jgi:hypothetical protein